MWYLYLLVVITFLIFTYTRLLKSKKYKFPPGPRGLPLIGNIHQLITNNPFETLSKWADNYGPIYTIKLASTTAVIINDPKLLRKIFSTKESIGKFQTDGALCISQGPYGILGNEGKSWHDQRQFCVKSLKQFGFGSSRMETPILLEASSVCDWITKMNTESKVGDSEVLLKMLPIFKQSVINIIWSMVTETRITLGDSDMSRLMKNYNDTLAYIMKSGLLFLPWLKYIAPEFFGYTAYNNACLDIHKFIMKEFEKHKQTFVPGAPRDLIDKYIEAYSGNSENMKHAIASVVELFVAGFETTGSVLTWLLHYLSQNPDVRKMAQTEIDKFIGKSQAPSLKDKSKMPFTEAVILETLRMSTVAPIGTPHRLLDDLEIDGYKFSKGIIPLANLYHCHYNKNVWGDPEIFRPERFLGREGKRVKEHFVPFSVGKRQCLGEHLAMDILFIYAAKILQQFEVMPDIKEKPEKYYEPDVGFLLIPQSLGLVIKPRSK